MSLKLTEVGKLFEGTYKLISWSSIYGVNTPFQLLLYCSAGFSFCGLSRFAAFIVTAVVPARWGRHIINRGCLCLSFVCLSFGIDCWITCCSLCSRGSYCSLCMAGRKEEGEVTFFQVYLNQQHQIISWTQCLFSINMGIYVYINIWIHTYH